MRRAGWQSLPLDAFGGVFPPMPTNPYKSREVAHLAMLGDQVSSDAETHLQTFVLPIDSFDWAPGSDPSSLRALRFRITGPAAGALYLDEIGIDPS